MAHLPKIGFKPFSKVESGTVVIPVGAKLELGKFAGGVASDAGLGKAAAAANFTGSSGVLNIYAPANAAFDRLTAVAEHSKSEQIGDEQDAAMALGGRIWAAISKSKGPVTLLADGPDGEYGPEAAAAIAAGMLLRAYKFDKYQTTQDDEDNGKASKSKDKPLSVTIQCADAPGAKKAFKATEAIAQGVIIARDLVNEPANILGPVEFAAKASELASLGVEIEVLTPKEMTKLGMRALLGVGLGSSRESRMVVMRWNGAKSKNAKPVAFVGKGVVFDTGGISIKPAASMEDMKGDMAGAACVTGLMHALAARKAKVNAIGVIGLVENMPDGAAQRPGDIVTAMSGTTIEIINTDAEGRLVLADALHYTVDRFKPQFVVNLATLTGAILVALGTARAGLFCNDDDLAGQLFEAGEATGDKVWRMPLGDAYDKMIKSKFADIKNTGGRYAGSITAAQFLQRFVGETPWAHLDIAGTGMASPSSDISDTWASGFGVRLLDRLVADHYEK
ncbi:MAG: leucyl aminopeptidase [Rhodobiaceae bacterium]|nr:leucyl aminopeptidase [Rhodobiaceae bacterium]MCC0013422.1 leucyl aminopeptidase [Rhodobiaceae bacterium]MCC0018233.1 leucyl aminopeptidase [Rhodobiaceae bacterium]MCC0050830.1 leucyl aminopeptidase [Rhodobiaceae bacterium]MCC0060525.1 leucyl aminopeptidase [Rhodobiaceae bacterium]